MKNIAEELSYMNRIRNSLIKKRIANDNNLFGQIMTSVDYFSFDPIEDRDIKKKKAEAMISAMKSGSLDNDPAYSYSLGCYRLNIDITSAINKEIKALDKDMEALAKQAPAHVLEFMINTKGFAIGSLGKIIGEAGDLSNYDTVSKLWKRFGLAVIGGARQGVGLKGNAELAAQHGYNKSRRCMIWNVGACLIRSSNPTYRAIYDAEKARQMALNADMSKGHAHNRATRKMTKEFVKDLWVCWNQAEVKDAVAA